MKFLLNEKEITPVSNISNISHSSIYNTKNNIDLQHKFVCK